MVVKRSGKRVLSLVALVGILSSVYPSVLVDSPVLNEEERARLELGELVVREVETEDVEGLTLEIIGVMQAPAATVFQIISDYKTYPEYMTSVDHVEMNDQQGTESTISYTLKAFLGIVKRHRVKISATRHEETAWKVQWALVAWPELTELETIRDTQGFWLIMERTPESALVYYQVYSDPGPVPFGLGSIVKALSKSSIVEAFTETKAEVEKQNLSPEP